MTSLSLEEEIALRVTKLRLKGVPDTPAVRTMISNWTLRAKVAPTMDRARRQLKMWDHFIAQDSYTVEWWSGSVKPITPAEATAYEERIAETAEI